MLVPDKIPKILRDKPLVGLLDSKHVFISNDDEIRLQHRLELMILELSTDFVVCTKYQKLAIMP